MKRPSFQWYPGDWLRCPEVRACSLLARGLWIDMLSLMHEGEPYGHLTLNGQPITEEVLARLVGEPLDLLRVCFVELERFGVFSRTTAGVIYSRRMVRDEKIRLELHQERARAGKEGGRKSGIKRSYPAKQNGSKPPSKTQANREANTQAKRSSSSSSSSSEREREEDARATESLDPEITALEGALCEICDHLPGAISQSKWMNLKTVSAELERIGATADLVREFGREWKRQRPNFSAPQLNQVLDDWLRIMGKPAKRDTPASPGPPKGCPKCTVGRGALPGYVPVDTGTGIPEWAKCECNRSDATATGNQATAQR